MSQIDDLISEHCPDGVRTQPLSELASYVRGVTYGKNDEQENGPLRVLRSNNITLASNTLNFNDVKHVSSNVRIRDNQRLYANDILISAASGSKSHVGKVAFIWEDLPGIVFGGFMAVLRANATLEPRFLFHMLIGRRFSEHLDRTLSTTTINNLNASIMGSFVVPVPPLEVQREIARILDQFTQLEAELEAELDIRVRQRLAFASAHFGVVYSTARQTDHPTRVRLGDVATQYIEPVRVEAEETYENLGLRWYGSGVFARDSKRGSSIRAKTLFRVKPGLFVYNRMFVVEGSFGIVTPGLAQGVVSNEFPAYELDSTRVLGAWLLHYLLDDYTLKRVAAEVTGVERGSMKSRRRWKEDQFEAFEIDLPSVETQGEVVRVLGTFSELESALREELAGRRKQYEFYRDRLLTFKERGT